MHCVVLYCKMPSGKREKIRVDVLEQVGEKKDIRWDIVRKKVEAEGMKGFEERRHGSSVCLCRVQLTWIRCVHLG